MSLVPLSSVKSAGGFKTTDNDPDLQVALNGAETLIARRIGPLASAPVTEVVNGRSYHLTLTKFPNPVLTSVTDWLGAPIDTSLLYVDAGVVRYLDPWVWFYQQRYTVAYTIGNGWTANNLDPDVMTAIVEMTRLLWKPRRREDRNQVNDPETQAVPTALPARVQELLRPFIPLPDA